MYFHFIVSCRCRCRCWQQSLPSLPASSYSLPRSSLLPEFSLQKQTSAFSTTPLHCVCWSRVKQFNIKIKIFLFKLPSGVGTMIYLPLTVWLLGADHGHGQVKSSWTHFYSCFEKWDFEKENMFFLGLATRGQDHPLLHSFCGKLKHLQIQTRKCQIQNTKDKTESFCCRFTTL